jgi:hypothetical protein
MLCVIYGQGAHRSGGEPTGPDASEDRVVRSRAAGAVIGWSWPNERGEAPSKRLGKP